MEHYRDWTEDANMDHTGATNFIFLEYGEDIKIGSRDDVRKKRWEVLIKSLAALLPVIIQISRGLD